MLDFFNDLLNSKTDLSIKSEQNFLDTNKEILNRNISFKPIEKTMSTGMEHNKKVPLKKSGIYTLIDMAKEHSEKAGVKSGIQAHLINKSNSQTILINREEIYNNFTYPPLNLKLLSLRENIIIIINSHINSHYYH